MRKRILSLMLLVGIMAVAPINSNAFDCGKCKSEQASFKQINHIQVPATNIASPMDVNVILPESYATSCGKSYPVVYILHGYGGDYKTWLELTEPRLDSLASNYDMIFVLPDGRDSWYFDSPENPELKMESFFVEELVPYIDKNYRTIADAKHRAITGLSMGGHGSLWYGMRHSDVWGSAGSMSGGVNFDKEKWQKSWKIAQTLGSREQNAERWSSRTVVSLVPTLKPDQLNIIFDCGIDDFFIGVNRELNEELLKYNIPHDYTERPGRHTHPYWKNSIRYHLQFFHDIFIK